MIVADTDVLIDFLRGTGSSAERVALELRSGTLATTTITAFELWTGTTSPRQASAVAALLGAIDVLPLAAESARARAGADAYSDLRGGGQELGIADCLIAGICLVSRAVLLTRNQRHFERIGGLQISRHGPSQE